MQTTIRDLLYNKSEYSELESWILILKENKYRAAWSIVTAMESDVLEDLSDDHHALFCPIALMTRKDWEIENVIDKPSLDELSKDGYLLMVYNNTLGNFILCNSDGKQLALLPLQAETELGTVSNAIHRAALIGDGINEMDLEDEDELEDVLDSSTIERLNYYTLGLIADEDYIIPMSGSIVYVLMNEDGSEHCMLSSWHFTVCLDHPIEINRVLTDN